MIAAWLPTDLEASELEPILTDPTWFATEKLDGVHVIAHVDEAGWVTCTNRRGEPYAGMPPALTKAIAAIFPPGSIVDGEFLQRAGRFVAFDLLTLAGRDLCREWCAYRWTVLAGAVPCSDLIQVVDAAFTEAQKIDMLERLMNERAEGLILKKHDAPYTPGRPAVGGPMRRLKFRKTCDLIIQRRKAADTKHSFEMFAIDGDGTTRNVGSVNANTLDPATRKPFYDSLRPEGFAVAEISYLYASDTYRLVQPTLVRVRTDKDPTDCGIDQLVISKRFDPASV